ncbi:MAG: DMT family transporter [Rhodospirillales bacterium]|nr:DMT family transporter [Rhodospirillales bacterium]
MPAVFVLLWSTGFIGAKFGMPYAQPFTFLLTRYVVVASALAIAAVARGAPWPRRWGDIRRIALVGVLIHAIYLGGVFLAISLGVPAGIAALIVSLQPLATALLSGPYLGERVSAVQWTGLVLGFAGVVLVVVDKLTWSHGQFAGVGAAVVALLGITAGTLYQKRHATGMNLITGSCVQFAAAGLATVPVVLLFEGRGIEWTGSFVFALLWLSFVLSIGAITLFHMLIRRGAAAKVASLFYLTPAVTAVLAWLLFDETLGWTAIGGMVVAMLGVALVARR